MASVTTTAEIHGGVRRQLREAVLTSDVTNGAALAAHDDRMRRGSIARIPNPLHDLPVRDAGCAEEDVLSRDQIGRREHLIQIMAGLEGCASLSLVAGPQATLNASSETTHRAGRDDPLGSSPDASEHVDTRSLPSRHDGAGNVSVHDELDARAGRSNIVDERVVARSVENAHGQIGDPLTFRSRDLLQVPLNRSSDVDRVNTVGPDDKLFAYRRPRWDRTSHRARRPR